MFVFLFSSNGFAKTTQIYIEVFKLLWFNISNVSAVVMWIVTLLPKKNNSVTHINPVPWHYVSRYVSRLCVTLHTHVCMCHIHMCVCVKLGTPLWGVSTPPQVLKVCANDSTHQAESFAYTFIAHGAVDPHQRWVTPGRTHTHMCMCRDQKRDTY